MRAKLKAGFAQGRVLLATFLLAASVGSTARAREFRAADIQTPDYPTVQALEFMGRRIAERTQGRHGIRVFHSRQLGEENETIEQTRVGAIDINRINIAPLAAAAPELNVLSMPFLFRSERHLHAALDGAFGADLLASVAGHGFVGLAFYDSGARSLYNSVRPIRSVADVKGLTVRVQPSELMEAMVNAMGARAMQMAYGQVLTGLQTKIIEGAENNWPSYVSTQHYKYARYYTLTEHSMAPEIVVMSKRAWDGLDEADRAVFREAAHESSLVMREKWREVEDASRRKAAAEGNVIIADFDRKSFVDVMAPIHDRMAADARIAPLIRRVRELE